MLYLGDSVSPGYSLKKGYSPRKSFGRWWRW